MLGLADRSKVIQILKEVFEGNSQNAINILKELFSDGIEAKHFLNDILDILSLINRKLSLGTIEHDKVLPEEEINLINNISNGIDINDIGVFWQFTIKTIDDLRIINDDEITLEMYILQLIHLISIGGNMEEKSFVDTKLSGDQKKILKNTENFQENKSLKVKNQLKNTDQVKTSLIEKPKLNNDKLIKNKINTFEDIVKLANSENEIELKYDLERNVKLVNFSKGNIDISFNEKLNKNFIKILTEKLFEWTGERWIISLNKKIGEKTIFEKKYELKENKINKAKNNKKIKTIIETFGDANLIDVEEDTGQ